MINRFIVVFAVCLSIQIEGRSQGHGIYMPAEIQHAYISGTRAYDGNPGPEYWQNRVRYSIRVSVDPVHKRITGTEDVVFINNSPDELHTLTIRLYGDVYKEGNIRYYSIPPGKVTRGIELEKIAVNGQEYDQHNPDEVTRNGTNMWVMLKEPLLPGDSLVFTCSWDQTLPRLNNFFQRTGYVESNNFFVALWYPQISVYDDIFGWDNLNYTFVTEFYNNLSDFDVEITVPPNYMVWATGTLQHPEKNFTSGILDAYNHALTSTETIDIISKTNRETAYQTIDTTWKYTADHVSDFSFAVGSDFLWKASSQKVEDRKVLINVVFPGNDPHAYDGIVEILRKSIHHLSTDFPGVPYPYETYTVFIGNTPDGGMEFPMMSNNGLPDLDITVHELVHNYFPMYVRINERRWVWMDEAWAIHNTNIIIERYLKVKPDFKNIYSAGRMTLKYMEGRISELPLMVTADRYTSMNEFFYSMNLAGSVFSMLHLYLGEEMFLKCYREYIKRWAEKSPTPYDLFFTFEDVSGKSLDWIWKPWFFEVGAPDLELTRIGESTLSILNKGHKPLPLVLEIEYIDGTQKEMHKSMEDWKDGTNCIQVNLEDAGRIKQVILNRRFPDVNSMDNYLSFLAPDKLYGTRVSEFIGVYHTPYIDLNILEVNGLLVLKEDKLDPGTVLLPVTGDTFRAPDDDYIEYEFTRDETGTVRTLVVRYTQYGFEFSGEKIR